MAAQETTTSAVRQAGWLQQVACQREEMPAATWPEQWRTWQARALTGLVEVQGGEDSIVYLFTEGSVMGAYRYQEGSFFKIDTLPELAAHLASLTIWVVQLPLDGVRAMKTLLERGTPLETRALSTAELQTFCEEVASHTVGVLHVKWEDAEGLLVLSGRVPSAGVFIHNQTVANGPNGLTKIYTYPVSRCRVHIYPEVLDEPVLSEEDALVRLAFAMFADAVLFRYIELTGRRMGNSLIAEMNRITRARGWSIRFSRNGVADTHTFAHGDEAQQVYRTLIQLLVGHISIVVGDMLAHALMRQALDRMDRRLQAAAHRLVPLPAVA
ncbi:MAG: hypothetical protein Q9O62_12870 [Ardenticatenia bacterium]|nr:hypothetical protein [Ardenticatenia bacterium]